MKNSKLRRILLTLACAVLLVSLSVGATLAYLTSKTDPVQNTFTVGNVAITLDEAKVDEYGVPVEGAERVMKNTYKLIPKATYTKDPIVYVSDNSEDCWIFVKVYNGLKTEFSGMADIETTIEEKTIAAQMTANDWICVDSVNNIWGYHQVVSENTSWPVFETFTLNDTATQEQLEAIVDGGTCYIYIQAFAIQAEGLTTLTAAWDAAQFNGWAF